MQELERNIDVCNGQGQGRFGSEDPNIFKEKHLSSKRTKHATNFSLKILIDFLEVRGLSADIISLTRKELSGILEDYCNVRMRDGEFTRRILC